MALRKTAEPQGPTGLMAEQNVPLEQYPFPQAVKNAANDALLEERKALEIGQRITSLNEGIETAEGDLNTELQAAESSVAAAQQALEEAKQAAQQKVERRRAALAELREEVAKLGREQTAASDNADDHKLMIHLLCQQKQIPRPVLPKVVLAPPQQPTQPSSQAPGPQPIPPQQLREGPLGNAPLSDTQSWETVPPLERQTRDALNGQVS